MTGSGRAERVGVAIGMAAGMIWTVALYWLGPALFRPAGQPLEIAALSLIVPALCLIVLIGRVAGSRFFDDTIIDGQDPAPGSPTEATLRVLRNTLEQAVLAALIWPALAMIAGPGRLGILPALAISFLLGRIAFWAGYRRGAAARAFGFAITFYPGVAAALWALFHFLRGIL